MAKQKEEQKTDQEILEEALEKIGFYSYRLTSFEYSSPFGGGTKMVVLYQPLVFNEDGSKQ